VLLGKNTERVQQFGHDQLSTFGIGSDLTELAWRGVFRQLTASGLLAVDTEGFGGLKLTAESRDVLKGGKAVTFRVEETKKATRKSKKIFGETREAGTGGRAVRGSVKPGDERLWEALREARLKFSREQNVPPYVIFHDATLMEMLKRRPKDLAEFATISGVGANKLERYGKAFLAVLDAHW
ncbi:MAG: RQC domain-containing protein, partial [Betaproteobacteria bacterium]